VTSSANEFLRLEVAEDIATITFDRPPVNAIDRPTFVHLAALFDSLRDRQDVRVAILTAAGDRAFVAGIDLRTFHEAEPEPTPTEVADPGRRARDAMWAIKNCAVPVIAAVNGPAIGAGLALVACCDIIVAAEGATFGTTEINVGLLGASAHLSRLVGRYKAREMFFTGELVPAEELHRLGAVRAVVGPGELMATARSLAMTLAAKSPLALRMAKESMNRVEDLGLEDAYRIEQDYTERLLRLEDAAEARRAFFEKRDPEWRWR
jgi:enoyl-CoA hydratase